MAIFSKKTNTNEQKAVVASTDHGMRTSLAHILRNPRITEKATAHALASAYIFDVAPRATKREIMVAVKEVYKVTPQKVTIAAIPRKSVRNPRTGKVGVKGGGKKAYVYLKKGETITVA
ncbi:50S ribosomal protein L23 [Candidatus Kaiserbacteria bacterium]|nr:50S ribosomal protein L23 [Candidatus Kaiserbacteria bacterium]